MCVINSLCSKGFTERIVNVKRSKSGGARYNPFPPKGDGGVGGLVNKIVFEIITRCIASNYTYTLHLHFHSSIKQSRIITDKFHFALCQKTKEQNGTMLTSKA